MSDEINFKEIVEKANDVIIVTKAHPLNEPGPEIIYVNPAFEQLTGYSYEEAIGKNPRILQDEQLTDSETKKTIRKALEKKEPVRVMVKNISKTGEAYWLDLSIVPLTDEKGEVTHFAAIERDGTEQKAREEKLYNLSQKDALTDLANRRVLEGELNSEFSRFKRLGMVFSLLVIDVDYFKEVNDDHGHSMGDAVLCAISNHLKKNVRLYDTVCRWGGDEFCILLPYTTKDIAQSLADKLKHDIASIPFENDLKTSISIGVSEATLEDINAMDIFDRADAALYADKESRSK